MSVLDWKARAMSSLLTGTSRQPLPAEAAGITLRQDASLQVLSLLGQALRFVPPEPPAHYEIETWPLDTRTLLPDSVRRPLIRLLAGRSETEHPALAIAAAFDDLRLRPHPFDLSRLEAFVRSHADQLGTTTQQWARPKQDTAGYDDDEVIDEQNWAQAPAKQRAAYLEQARRTDPAAALALLQAAWPNDTADTHVRLLACLQPTLAATDLVFLGNLSRDRAPRVRSLAARMLRQLGAGAENPALKSILTRINRHKSGILRERLALSISLPALVKDQAAFGWLREQFSEVSFVELSSALALDEFDLIRAAARYQDEGNPQRLLVALALVAIADRRLDLFEFIVRKHLHNAWELLFQTGLYSLGHMPRSERLRWANALVAPYGQKLPTSLLLWSWLHRLLSAPGPEGLIDTILKTRWLEELGDLEKQGPHWLEVIVALCPPGHYADLRIRLAMAERLASNTALALLDILMEMENTRKHV